LQEILSAKMNSFAKILFIGLLATTQAKHIIREAHQCGKYPKFVQKLMVLCLTVCTINYAISLVEGEI